MPKCEYCGKEVPFPFKCPYCGRTFCAEHRLPETHQCPNLPEEKFWYQKGKAIEREAKQQRIKEGELYFIKESPSRKEPKRTAEQKTDRSKKKRIGMILAFCVILIVISILVSYTSYNFGYSTGYNVAYNKSYNLGHSKGYDEGYVDGNLSGYEEGYIQGVIDGAGTGYNIRDPTYQEALQFIASDQTNKKQYNEETYTCVNFAADFKNNAFKAEYRCGFVEIEFPDLSHAIVCFNTTDQGVIFIEPQDDEIVTLGIGQPYWDRTKYQITYDDTVVRFMIVW